MMPLAPHFAKSGHDATRHRVDAINIFGVPFCIEKLSLHSLGEVCLGAMKPPSSETFHDRVSLLQRRAPLLPFES